MNITKGQLKEYIQIQKKVRGVDLTEKDATKEAQSLLAFVKAIYELKSEVPKRQKKLSNNNKQKIWENI